jgi:predicted enzyme related to lactoylglutathione lyase
MSRRLVGFMIDCERAEIGAAAKFWSGALGLPIEDPDENGDGRYAVLGSGPAGLHVEVQRVDHASRLHLDVECDDIEAEATALEALGASRVANPHKRFWVMQAPTGHRFCLVRKRDREFPSRPRRSTLPLRHHSVLIALVIDCQVEDLEPALRFWSAALERRIASHDQDGDGRYGELETGPDEVFVLLQKVTHESRVHLDIQTDDLDAEVARLERLGARREKFLKRWWVMQAPTGHRFCVVRQQPAKAGISPNTWGRRA